MKTKFKFNKFVLGILPFFITLTMVGVGFGAWVAVDQRVSKIQTGNISLNVGDVKADSPLTLVSVEPDAELTNNKGICKIHYENVNGKDYKYLSLGATDLRIRYTFELDNSKYKYYAASTYLICIYMELSISGINEGIVQFLGADPSQFVFENGAGWWPVNYFTDSYNMHTKTQTLKSSEHNVTNTSPNEPKTRFFMEFVYRDFSSLISGSQVNFSLKVNLKYNQVKR